MSRREDGPHDLRVAAASIANDRLLVAFANRPYDGMLDLASLRQSCAGCEFTLDSARSAEADCIVFHVPTLEAALPRSKPPGQRWVAWSMESEASYPLLAMHEFMRRFDCTMGYRRDATVWTPYFGPGIERALLSPPQPKTQAAPAVYVTSNERDTSGRRRYVAELMRHLRVDSYGRSLRNRALPRGDDGRQTKLGLVGGYKFTLAFENSIGRDYVTEKLFDPLIAGSVPVYLGAPNVDDLAPAERCYVDVRRYPRPADLAAELSRLAEDPAEYASYLAWKREGRLRASFLADLRELAIDPMVRLCRVLREGASPRPSSGDAAAAVAAR